jgi:hypothetical protein
MNSTRGTQVVAGRSFTKIIEKGGGFGVRKKPLLIDGLLIDLPDENGDFRRGMYQVKTV